MQPVTIEYKGYFLNLIDTPGHIDFNYEVSRALKAVEGVILLIDGTQGIQAQTVHNLELAKKENLVIIPAINKIDLQIPNLDDLLEDIYKLAGEKEVYLISAKLGTGVEELLSVVIEKIPSPRINADSKQINADSKQINADSKLINADSKLINSDSERINADKNIPRINADFKLIKTDKQYPYKSVPNPNESVDENNPHKSVLDPYLSVVERHRHRYEVNPKFHKILEENGLIFSGIHRLTLFTDLNGFKTIHGFNGFRTDITDKKYLHKSVKEGPRESASSLRQSASGPRESAFLVEIIELPESLHPFFLGTQFHPELKSRFLHPHPLFVEFVKSGSGRWVIRDGNLDYN